GCAISKREKRGRVHILLRHREIDARGRTMQPLNPTPFFAHIEWAGRPVRVEYEWSGAQAGPVMVFLHEGLGSLSMWRDFPARLAKALGMRGLVYSRPGYGKSTPRSAD